MLDVEDHRLKGTRDLAAAARRLHAIIEEERWQDAYEALQSAFAIHGTIEAMVERELERGEGAAD
jgi:hypothetical protein